MSWERRFNSLVNASPNPVIVVDMGGVIRFANRSANKLLERDELLGEVFGYPVLGEGTTEIVVLTHSRFRFFEMHVNDTEWDDISAHVIVLVDITQRKQLQENEVRFRMIFENSLDAILLTRPDGQILMANRSACRELGMEESEIKAKGRQGLIVFNEQAVRFLEERSKTRHYRGELTFIRKDLTQFVTEVTSSIFYDDLGLPHSVVIFRDMTRLLQAQETLKRFNIELETQVEQRTQQLKATIEQVETILNSINDMVVLIDPSGLMQTANHAFLAWVGVEPSEIVNLSFVDWLGVDVRQKIVDVLWKVVLQDAVERVEFGVIVRGNRFILEGVFSRVDGTTGIPVQVVCSLRDVSLQKAIEEYLRRALDHEKELREIKSSFISMVSHEFRTPLAVILSSAGLLDNYDDKLTPDKRHKHYQKIMAQVTRLTQMMTDTLFLTRSEEQNLIFNPESVNIAETIQEMLDEVRSGEFENYPLSVELSSNNCAGALDVELLRHIILNLMTNAMKYSLNREPVEVKVTCKPPDLEITISDCGIGIPAESLEHLFDQFHRAKNVGGISGTGLGLPIVKRAVDAHGGSITIDSEEGRGTTVTVCLPHVFSSPQAS